MSNIASSNETVSLRLSPVLLESIKREARRLSHERQQDVTWTSIVRELLYQRFPITADDHPTPPAECYDD